MEMYRLIELTLHAVLRFLPYLLLMYYIFKDSLRFPKWLTVVGIGLLTALRCLCGILPYFNPALLDRPNPGIIIIVILTVFFVKGNFGKSLFNMLMLVNISGFCVVVAKFTEGCSFPIMPSLFIDGRTVLPSFLSRQPS